MIRGEFWQIHDDAALEKIEAAAIRLLSQTGVRIEHEDMLRLVGEGGCRVDTAGRRCLFPEALLRKALAHLGGRAEDRVAIPPGWSPRPRTYQGGTHPHLLEWPCGRRRLATAQDVLEIGKMGHVLDEIEVVGRALCCSEVNQRIEPLWSTLQLARLTNKQIGAGEVFFADTLAPLVCMGEVLTGKPGDTSLVPSCDFFIAPLVLDHHQAACFLEKRRLGVPNCPGTMPVSGMSAPVTIAGTVTVALAELIAGWVIGYLVAPDLPAAAIVATGSMDMRTSSVCFGSPEACLQNASVVNIARRLYGMQVYAAVGYTDCKRPGLEAAFMKMFGLLAAPLGTSRSLPCDGLLSAGQDYSPVQQILELEMNHAVQRFWGQYEVSDEAIAVGLIEEQMRGSTTNFLETEHTFAHFRAEQWYPRWLDRSAWQGTEAETHSEHRLLQRIDAYCRDAIRRYEPPDIDGAKIAELERIVAAAER